MIFSVENEQQLGQEVWRLIKDKMRAGFCVGLIGDLGAGKTTLVKAIAEQLGVSEAVSSPTFTIAKLYEIGFKNSTILQHIDLYRLEKASDADAEEVLDMVTRDDAITFVEWPEKVRPVLDKMNLLIKITPLGEESRKVEIREN